MLAWRLDEEAPQLLSMCREQGVSCDDLSDLPTKRQREKATERLLLCRAFGHPVTLTHDDQGAPLVEGSGVNISFSHTPQLVVLACDDERVIGIDAESVDRRQVLRVRDKYLNNKEKQFVVPDDLAAHIIAWTAKEAVIKAERNSALDWTDGIVLEPFTIDTDETDFMAHCGDRCYRLVSRLVEGHHITVAIPAEE